jgi:VWFA-related protein
VLAAALSNKKNIEVETPAMLKSQAESNAQDRVVAMGAAGLWHLFAEMDAASEDDRKLITLANLQRLAAFLGGFPGRKNIIWFTERAPGFFEPGGATGNPAVDDEIEKTIAMLGSVRAALYPVDARGTSNYGQYTAENNPAAISTAGEALRAEDAVRNNDQLNAQILAEKSGGRAFANRNGLSDIIGEVTSNSAHFYTLSYVPSSVRMDGRYRKIGVKVEGGKYSLSYRRGYFAVDRDHPADTTNAGKPKMQKAAAQSTAEADPLLPFMDLGMPESEQILYKVRVVQAAAVKGEPADKKASEHYTVGFAIDLNDLKLDLGADGLHKGTLNIELIVYDRYGNVISREDHVAALNIKPDVYAAFQQAGVQVHADLAVPNGNYWLRTGVYDKGSRKVGTMEIALSSVVPLQVSAR